MNINWKMVAAALTSTLTVLAALPYSLGELATIIPPSAKGYVVTVGLIATTILRIWNTKLTPPATVNTYTTTSSDTTVVAPTTSAQKTSV